MGFIYWIVVGLIAGWLAGKIARGRGYGCITDIILGLIGSLLGGWIFTRLGIVGANSFLYSLAAATVGAIILVSIVHLFVGGDKLNVKRRSIIYTETNVGCNLRVALIDIYKRSLGLISVPQIVYRSSID